MALHNIYEVVPTDEALLHIHYERRVIDCYPLWGCVETQVYSIKGNNRSPHLAPNQDISFDRATLVMSMRGNVSCGFIETLTPQETMNTILGQAPEQVGELPHKEGFLAHRPN
jgi:hypothetical protein